MYLRNISAKTTGLDELLLNVGSAVWVNSNTTDDGDQEGKGVAGTGLEYSARVGMVVYGNTISTTATDTAEKTIGEQIRELGAKGDEVAAIWEPNNKEHTAYVVANNGRGITSTSQEVDTYGIKVAVASAATKEIANINSTTDSNLVAVNTFTPEYTTVEDGIDTKTIITNTQGNNLGIVPNQISKVRVYIWLEGQDPDCIDLASTGDKLNVTLKLTKNQTPTIDKNIYSSASPGTILTTNEVSTYEYGAVVTNYAASDSDAQKSVNWRIFHTDGTNIYLIADDYVQTQYIPAGKGNTTITIDTEDEYAQGFALTDVRSDYAIGGPTLELFTASYNATHPDKTIDTQVDSELGYKVKWNTDADYVYYIKGINTSEDLYVISDIANALGMWLATPSADFSVHDITYYHLMRMRSNGSVGYDYYTSLCNGARPIVCLKSNVKLEKQSDNTFKIVE